MKVVGVDLAGAVKNDSGFCELTVDDADKKTVSTCILHTDEEIISKINSLDPDVLALDAPINFEGHNRKCDDLLREYGALPVTLPGMEVLAKRGTELAKKLGGGRQLIEVHSKSSAKILGVFDKDDFACQKKTTSLDLDGDVNTRLLSRDELDSIFAALTGYLHLVGRTKAVGGEDGLIYVPEV